MPGRRIEMTLPGDDSTYIRTYWHDGNMTDWDIVLDMLNVMGESQCDSATFADVLGPNLPTLFGKAIDPRTCPREYAILTSPYLLLQD